MLGLKVLLTTMIQTLPQADSSTSSSIDPLLSTAISAEWLYAIGSSWRKVNRRDWLLTLQEAVESSRHFSFKNWHTNLIAYILTFGFGMKYTRHYSCNKSHIQDIFSLPCPYRYVCEKSVSKNRWNRINCYKSFRIL